MIGGGCFWASIVLVDAPDDPETMLGINKGEVVALSLVVAFRVLSPAVAVCAEVFREDGFGELLLSKDEILETELHEDDSCPEEAAPYE